jgi:sporulation protein YlmC with PRC-barrel domain
MSERKQTTDDRNENSQRTTGEYDGLRNGRSGHETGTEGRREREGGDGRARATGDALVEINELRKIYDPDGAHVTAVEDLDLDIGDNEFVTVLVEKARSWSASPATSNPPRVRYSSTAIPWRDPTPPEA